MVRRLVFALATLLLVAGLVAADVGSSPPVPPVGTAARERPPVTSPVHRVTGARPNIVLITTDDQVDDEMRWMPRTRRLLGAAGVTFRDMVSPHPLCCPARAEILTGQFAQNNGVRTNWGPFGGFKAMNSYRDTIAPWLHSAGYSTGFVGKFLNGYRSTSRRVPGWDEWHPLLQDGGLYRYYGFAQRHDDAVRVYRRGYVTDVLTRTSNRLLRTFAGRSRPFFLWVSHVAPHQACIVGRRGCRWGPPIPAVRDRSVLEHVRPPSFNDPAFLERDVSDKPSYLWGLDRSSSRRGEIRRLFTRRIQSLRAVDRSVARTIRVLRETGELADTVVVFTSDNGFLLGEHRWLDKHVPYEPALQVPLLVRGPGIPQGVTREATVAMVDLAPTFVDLGALTPTVPLDGRSLLPVLRSASSPGWQNLLIQDGPRHWAGDGARWFYRGVRTSRYTYVEYPRYGKELYDRLHDPYELRNVAGAPAYRAVLRTLHQRLLVLKDCAGAMCRREPGAVPRVGQTSDRRAATPPAP